MQQQQLKFDDNLYKQDFENNQFKPAAQIYPDNNQFKPNFAQIKPDNNQFKQDTQFKPDNVPYGNYPPPQPQKLQRQRFRFDVYGLIINMSAILVHIYYLIDTAVLDPIRTLKPVAIGLGIIFFTLGFALEVAQISLFVSSKLEKYRHESVIEFLTGYLDRRKVQIRKIVWIEESAFITGFLADGFIMIGALFFSLERKAANCKYSNENRKTVMFWLPMILAVVFSWCGLAFHCGMWIMSCLRSTRKWTAMFPIVIMILIVFSGIGFAIAVNILIENGFAC
ncbi:hypothetical protein HK098_002055 [Nowakowskiella sp. JEL0407]|nr:hypothetical protein HK098_002055 [Nowakowskiella sp. JEL0407]